MSDNFQIYRTVKTHSDAAVASTATATGEWFKTDNVKEFSFWVKATSAGGTSDVSVIVEQIPTTSVYVSGDPLVSTTVDASDTGEAWSEYVSTTVNAITAAQMRVKITGVNANPADTVATVYVSMRN